MEDKTIPNFGIFMWWAVNRSKCLILLKTTRDILIVLVSIIAFEPTFSTRDRFLSPHCIRLHLSTLEA